MQTTTLPPPSRQRTYAAALWAVLGIVMLAVIGGTLLSRLRAPTADLPLLFDAPVFSLTDQDGQPFGDAQLRGKPYIVDFIFTRCAGVCPLMSHNMADLQKQMPESNLRFVSFSVDPEFDTPAVLKEYAGRYKADSRWSFLTGPKETIFDIARGFKLSAVPATGTEGILHDEKFLLIDGKGHIRGIYSSKDSEKMAQLVKDGQALAKAGR